MTNLPTDAQTRTSLHRSASRAGAVSILMLAAASIALGSALATPQETSFQTIVLFGTKALAFLALALTWLIRSLPLHLPHQRIGPANAVTLGRLVLVALLVGLLGETEQFVPWFAVGLGVTCLALDGVDGWLARRGNWSTAFGAKLDMETDALLILLLSILVWQFEKAGAWIVLAGLTRYGFVLAGTRFSWLRAPLPESFRRKLICVVQAASLLIALAPVIPYTASWVIALTGLIALAGSFAIDTAYLYQHRSQASAQRSNNL